VHRSELNGSRVIEVGSEEKGEASGLFRWRAGSKALSLFSPPLNGLVLGALAAGSLPLADLRESVGCPPATTLRCALESLGEVDAVRPCQRDDKPQLGEIGLTPLGEELVGVADAIQAWLERAPGGPLELGSGPAKTAIRTLVDGWDTNLVRALAASPLTLGELDRLVEELSYPTLSRRLATMRGIGQAERGRLKGRWVHRLTDWSRQAVAPLALAVRFERRHWEEVAPITWIEVESAFLLILPIASFPDWLSGSCTLAVDTGAAASTGARSRVAGVRVEVREGRVAACSTRLEANPDTWALGAPESWLDAVIDGGDGGLYSGGVEPELPQALIEGIRETFVSPTRALNAA
jgi:DNA-binding HxlR family transcriptional regulator